MGSARLKEKPKPRQRIKPVASEVLRTSRGADAPAFVALD